MYRNRDISINYIKARKNHRCYGMGLGIIILDDIYPCFPGDVCNASVYPFPIQMGACNSTTPDTSNSQFEVSLRAPDVFTGAKQSPPVAWRLLRRKKRSSQ